MRYRNVYFALRHGMSTANEEGLIVSDPAKGVSGYGLSRNGRSAILQKLSAGQLAGMGFERSSTICLTSDFLRAKETAGLFCELNRLNPPVVEIRLRERWFGELEEKSTELYGQIWERDAKDPDHHHLGCESPREVADRIQGLIREMEEAYDSRKIVLVSHGDTLQIAQALFRGMPPNHHRRLSHLENAEIRRLTE